MYKTNQIKSMYIITNERFPLLSSTVNYEISAICLLLQNILLT